MVWKKVHVPWNKGLSKETDERLNYGKKILENRRSYNGINNPFYKKHHTENTIRKLPLIVKKKLSLLRI